METKKVLILAIGCSLKPWNKMFNTSLETWDSIEVDGVETIFYFGNPMQENTNKASYFPIEEHYNTMGNKMLKAFEWALKNKDFDYIARVNSSCYVDKNELIKHVQTLPEKDLFQGLIVPASENQFSWCWGGGQFIISKDVVSKIIIGQSLWDHNIMEDVALSKIVSDLYIPFTNGVACSIDANLSKDNFAYTCYGTTSFNSDKVVKAEGQFFYRVKTDRDRSVDEFLMKQLFKVL